MTAYRISEEWWENLLNSNLCLLISCALGAVDEGVFLDRLTFELTGTETGSFEFDSEQVYNDIAHFVGDVNTWMFVAYASHREHMNDEPGDARLCIENIDDESYDVLGVQNGHLVVQESGGWYGHVIGRPYNYTEAVAWVAAHAQS